MATPDRDIVPVEALIDDFKKKAKAVISLSASEVQPVLEEVVRFKIALVRANEEDDLKLKEEWNTYYDQYVGTDREVCASFIVISGIAYRLGL